MSINEAQVVKGSVEELVTDFNDAIINAANQLKNEPAKWKNTNSNLLHCLTQITGYLLNLNINEFTANVHASACSVLSAIHHLNRDKFLRQHNTLSLYLVNTLLSDNMTVSTAACKYWANLPMPPAQPSVMDQWMKVIHVKLEPITTSLLQAMKYQDVHQHFLKSNSSNPHSASIPSQVELCSDFRNYAAKALENFCRIFQSDVIKYVRHFVDKWFLCETATSQWQEQEAVMLALAACFEAMGPPRDMDDLWIKIVPRVLLLCRHSQPLVRLMTSFLMHHLVGQQMKGCRKLQGDILRETLRQLTDENDEVKEMALRTLTEILSQVRLSQKAVNTISNKLIHMENHSQSVDKYIYYTCIGQLLNSYTVSIDKATVDNLLQPLLADWVKINWSPTSAEFQSATEQVVQVCEPLCLIIATVKMLFKPHNEVILNSVCPSLKKMLSLKSTFDKSAEYSTRFVVYCDVLSAMFEGQGDEVSNLFNKHDVMSCVLTLLKQNTRLPDQVNQSVLALLGHFCYNDFMRVEPHLDDIVEMTSQLFLSTSPAVRNNVLWLIAQLTAKVQRKNAGLFRQVKLLENIITSGDEDVTFVINATLALTNLATKFPELAVTMLEQRIFQAICLLLPVQFARRQKSLIVSNLSTVLALHLNSPSLEDWVVFCSSICVPTLEDQLVHKIAQLLRDARATVGSNTWRQITKRLAPHVLTALHKKYKFY